MPEASIMIEVDSLVANEFEVKIGVETLHGLFHIDGLITFKIDESGNRVHPPFRIAKMVQRDGGNVFNQWIKETRSGDRPRRELVISAIDDGVETRRWTVHSAYITEITYNTFDTGSSEMVEEIATIAYEAIDEAWPVTD